MAGNVELGCGLIAIGRPWGTTPEVPSESSALEFLGAAYEMGIRHFDTAPSYGLSEERLGKFLFQLSAAERAEVTVSTKCGENWDPRTNEGTVSHKKMDLMSSIMRSKKLLGSFDVLQIHKATPAVLESEYVSEAIWDAKGMGVKNFGASASDVETAQFVLGDIAFNYLQVPYNAASPQFKEPIEESKELGFTVLTNRPFQMGKVAGEGVTDKYRAAVDAFRYILQTDFNGVVLSGTSNPEHLAENLRAFEEARATLDR